MLESDLYEPIREHFESKFYEVYAEVEVPLSGGRVDMIAYSYPAAIAIELKTSLTIDLIEQVMDRKAIFPIVYIGIPKRRKPPASWLFHFLREKGIGIIEVDTDGEVDIRLAARYKKPYFQKRYPIEKFLREEHKTWVKGGHAGGGYVTDYRITMVGVKHYLSQKRKFDELAGIKSPGWRSVKDIIDHCQTHYRTPKNSLGKALMEIEFEWCEVKRENRKLYFRAKG